jgi:membrane-associated phospholipid phosphatase
MWLAMNLTDRIYLAVHAGLTVLVCVRYEQVNRWPWYVAWNLAAMGTILMLARMRNRNTIWECAHDFLPGFVFFTTVFEEVSFLCRTVVGQWQNQQLSSWDAALFSMPAALWLRQHLPGWSAGLFDLGYFAFYPMYLVVGLVFWSWRKYPGYERAFRDMTDALSIGYTICYATFIAWPTQSPRHAGIVAPVSTGVFGWLIGVIQRNGGVHGNAFPSAHIMLAFVVLIFAWQYWRRAAPWLLAINVLMCLGAIYDGYHYAVDVMAGAVLGTVVGIAYLKCATSERASYFSV